MSEVTTPAVEEESKSVSPEPEEEEEETSPESSESSRKRSRAGKVVSDTVTNMYGVEVNLKGADVREFEANGKKWRKYTRNGSFVHIEEITETV